MGLGGQEGESTSPSPKPALRSLVEVLDEIRLAAELEEFQAMTPEQQEAVLREYGCDEEPLRKRIEDIRAEVYKARRC